MEFPKICCLDLDEKSINELSKIGFVYNGSLGDKIRYISEKNWGYQISKNQRYQILPKFIIPDNIQEYDIFVIDLEQCSIIEYPNDNQDFHYDYLNNIENIEDIEDIKEKNKILESERYLCTTNYFDYRPINSSILNKKFSSINKRPYVVIVFTTNSYDYEYIDVQSENKKICNIYDLLKCFMYSEPMNGKEMELTFEAINNNFEDIIKPHISGSYYSEIFTFGCNEYTSDFYPLIRNRNKDIISFYQKNDNQLLFFFPQLQSKDKFLYNFINKIVPTYLPEVFTDNEHHWINNNPMYYVPNQGIFIEEKKKLKEQYEKNDNKLDQVIKENNEKYFFLRDMLTESGEKLVDSIIEFFKWIGFDNVKNSDKINENLDEDIAIETKKGLLIIECKGINGTSTDNDCRQIFKIKNRRMRERGKMDVFSLYIVNHQRNIEPIKRKNPPFNPTQIKDSQDDYGLVSTWQLFKLYNLIEEGLIDKQDACEMFFDTGYIEFKPKNILKIDEARDIYHQKKVCIININDLELNVGEEIYIERDGDYRRALIEEIQKDDVSIKTANSGEIGLKLNIQIGKKSILWKKIQK